mmetsp:Transcript_3851/g.8680  ORF Transcript_3851/g.8680 Transcript_3851/m.8680 type:complete len:146 (+) Transcript_3851:118-555(+)
MSAPPPAGPLRPLSHTEPTAATLSRTPTIHRFSCCRCGFESHVDYHGRTPPFNRSIVFLEGVFLIRSPMGDANRPLCLGGTCVVCERQVCAAAKCSVFYTKRICADCLSRPEIAAQMPSPAAPASAVASTAVGTRAAVPQPNAKG